MKEKREEKKILSYRDFMERAAGVYVLIMFTVFPLFVHNGYLEVSDDKYYVFVFSTIALALVFAAASAVELIRVLRGTAEEKKALKASLAPKAVLRRLSVPDRFFCLFFLVLLLSTLSSEWLYEAFWGNMGRLQGLYTWIWYFTAYLLVSRFYRHREFYIRVFAAVGTVVALWGVTDLLGFDIAGWTDVLVGHTKYDFSSTFGNINMLTAVLALYAGSLSVFFVNAEGRRETALLYAAVVVQFAALIAGRSDSAIITIGAILCFLPFYAWNSTKGVLRWLAVTAAFLLALLLVAAGLRIFSQKALGQDEWGLLIKLAYGHTGLCAAAFLAAAGCLVFFVYGIRKNGDKRLSARPRLVWLGLGILAAAALISVIADANAGGHPELYAPYRNFLIFDEDWGTYRGYVWNYLVRQHRRFTLLKRLIGSGPETFGVYSQVYEFYDMLSKVGLYFDNPHSEPLDFYFNTGILGALTWYGTMLSLIISAFRSRGKSKNSGAACAFAFAFCVYLLQSAVNIVTVMSYGLLVVLMGMTSSILREADE